RRHTRFSRDWSSDVCSSDLGRHLNNRFGDTGCVWSIEFRKDFMDEWTGEPYIHRIAACKQLLINTLEHLKNYLPDAKSRSEEHTSELQSRENLVCRLLLEKKKKHLSQQKLNG